MQAKSKSQAKTKPDDTTDPLKIRILIESYTKEAHLRSLWNRKHEDVIKDAAILKREPKNYYETDVLKHLMVEGMPALTRDYIESGHNRNRILKDYEVLGVKHLRRGHGIVDIGIGDPNEDPRLVRDIDDLSLDPIMRPVPPVTKNILFGDEPSRKQYLRERLKCSPENKYYFPETTSFDYGWRLKDSCSKPEKRFARSGEFMKALRNRVGATPDPKHYEICPSKYLN